MSKEEHYHNMAVALAEANKAEKKGEVPIGAVLVNSSHQIIAKSHNQTISNCDPTAHAEIELLKKAAIKLQNYRLLNTTIYVTLEPCVMCMGALIHARVSTVVFGVLDSKWGAAGSLYNFASDHRFNHKIKLIRGIRFGQCRSLIQNFFKKKRKNS